MFEILNSIFRTLPIAGVDPITWVFYAIYAIAIGFAYSGMRQAQKAAKKASQFNTQNRQRGALYQVRGGAIPRRFIYGRQRVGGIEAYVAVSGGENEFLHYILIWGDGPCEEMERLLFDGNGLKMRNITTPGTPDDPETEEDESVPGEEVPGILVPDYGSPYEGHVRLENELGDQFPPSPHGQGIIPGWGPTDLMVGICYSWVELKYNEDVFPAGVPNIGAIIKGRNDIWDPRESVHKYTDNPALCLNHYMTLPKMGPGLNYAEEIGEDELIAAANICEEILAVPGPHASSGIVMPSFVPDAPASDGTIDLEFRYSFNGLVTLDTNTEDIIEDFRMSMAGITTYIGGKFRIYAGAYIVPTFTITKAMICGPIARRTKASRRDRLTGIRGVYAGEFTRWVPTDFPALIPQEYIDADGGEELVDDIELLNAKSPYTAQRIASIFLKRSRYSRELSIQCYLDAWQAQAGLTVFFDFPEIGFDNVPMDVSQLGLRVNSGKVIVELALRETNPAIYDEPPMQVPPGASSGIILPYPKPHVPDYSDLLHEIPAPVTTDCKQRGGTLFICGHDEFIDPVSPPAKYRKKFVSGTVQITEYTDSDVCISLYPGGGGVEADILVFYFFNEHVKVYCTARLNTIASNQYSYTISEAGFTPMEMPPMQVDEDTEWRLKYNGVVVNEGYNFLVNGGDFFTITVEVKALFGYQGYDFLFQAGADSVTDIWDQVFNYNALTCEQENSPNVLRLVADLTMGIPDKPGNPVALGRPDLYYLPNISPVVGPIQPVYMETTITRTQRVTFGLGCAEGIAFGPDSMGSTGLISDTLSEEDTESDAIFRLNISQPWDDIPWVVCGTYLGGSIFSPPCCFGEWEARTSGFGFFYKESRVSTIVRDLIPGETYMVRYNISKEHIATGNIIVNGFLTDLVGEADVNGTMSFEWNAPTERGWRTYISSVKVYGPPLVVEESGGP